MRAIAEHEPPCVHEAGRAVEPREESWIEEVKPAARVPADETDWKEGAEGLGLECWVVIARRPSPGTW